MKKNTGDGISLVGTMLGATTGNIVDHNHVESNGTPASGMTPAVGDGIHADAQ